MYPLFFFPPVDLAHPLELPPLPLSLKLGFAGAVALVTALALTLS